MSTVGIVRAYIDIETTALDPAEGELTVVGIHLEQDGQQKVKAEAKVKVEARESGSPPFSTLTSTSTSPLAAALWNDYRLNGNSEAIRTLLLYNSEDVRNLAHIRRKLGVS